MKAPAEGHLLKQIFVLDTPMGLAYERSIGFEKSTHAHDRLMIVCPRGATRMEVTTGEPARHEVESSTVLLVPKGMPHADLSLSEVYDTLALYPNDQFVAQMLSENGLGAEEEKKLHSSLRLKRTRWLDDILDRYFFERVLNYASPIGCTFFLEKQILNEIARIAFKDKFLEYGRNVGDEAEDSATRALQFIESNLFEPLDLETIARHARTSGSSLTRIFKKEFKRTPYAYIRSRRLDEAATLLQKGDYTVSDVSLLVGYEDFSSFSKAFKQRFGTTPSAKVLA